ncbi:unnamed protein product [Pedinophyceae sp. YPF-701]|nr:unnamed protein product [Pedinophyceae sp. YPF-701]
MPFEDIPGPKVYPLVGNLFEFFKYPNKVHLLYDEWFRTYGPIFKYTVAGKTSVMVSDPSDIEKVFKFKPQEANRGMQEPFVHYRDKNNLPRGLSQTQGEEWRRNRGVADNMSKPRIVDSYVPRVQDIAAEYAAAVAAASEANGGSLDAAAVRERSQMFSLEAIVSILLNLRMGALQPNPPAATGEFAAAVEGMFRAGEKFMFSLWPWDRSTALEESDQAWDDVFRIARKFIAREVPVMREIDDGSPSFFDIMASTGKLSDQELEVMKMELVAAGVDTTSSAMVNILWALARSPEWQDRVFQQACEALDWDGTGDVPAIEDPAALRERLPVLNHVVSEGLRLHPVVPLNLRILDEDIVLRGYRIPAGHEIMLSVYSTGRMAEHVGTDAERFNPGRFALSNPSRPSRFATAGFGAMARQCAGKAIAEMQLEMVVLNMVLRYRLSVRGGQPEMVTRMIMNMDLDSLGPLVIERRS